MIAGADILVVRGRIAELARMPLLAPREQRRADSLGLAFVAGRTLLRRVLGRFLDPQVELDEPPDGKPQLARDVGIDFNVSHAGELVLVAVAKQRRVGVDVEVISHRRDVAAIAEAALGSEAALELRHTAVEHRAARFTCWWVRIEAQCKATGAGLTFPIEIPPGLAVRDIAVHAGYRAAVAFDGGPAVIRTHDWSTP